MGFCYWRALGLAPDVLSPFLQEIWVAPGLFHNQRQRVLPNFDALGVLPDSVEQHSLADTAKPDHQQAFAGSAQPATLKVDSRRIKQGLPAGKLRRLRAGAGRIRLRIGSMWEI